jgi:hypothetical protein
MRAEAATLDEIANSIRGRRYFKLEPAELRGCAAWIAGIGATGAFLLWFGYGPKWVGGGVIALAIASIGAVFWMQTDKD